MRHANFAEYVNDLQVTTNPPYSVGVKKKSFAGRAFRLLAKILLWIIIGIVVLFTALVAIVYFFEDNLKKYALNRLNEQLVAPVQFSEVHFSAFRRFPHVSLEFKNVVCVEPVKDKDAPVFLEAGSVFLEFSIWDIIRNKYVARKITIRNGNAHLVIYEDGSTNFKIWKDGKAAAKNAKAIDFNIKSLQIDNFLLDISSVADSFRIISDIQSLKLKGNFSEKAFRLQASGNVYMSLLAIQGTRYIEDKMVSLSTQLNVDLQAREYTIRKAVLGIEKMQIEAQGLIRAGKAPYIDITYKGKNVDIASFLSLIPGTRGFSKDYSSAGKFYAEGLVKGDMGKGQMPLIKADFGIDGGSVTYKPRKTTMRDVHVIGSFTSGKSPSMDDAVLELKDIRGKINQSVITGWVKIAGFRLPEVWFTTQSDIRLEDVTAFVPQDFVKDAQGSAAINLSYHSKWGEGKSNRRYIEGSEISGSATLSGTQFRLRDIRPMFRDVSGTLQFDGKNAKISQLKGTAGSSDFLVNGTCSGLMEYILLDNSILGITADFYASSVDLEEWMGISTNASIVATSPPAFKLPSRIRVNLNTEIGRLKFRRFSAINITGIVGMHAQVLVADKISMTSCGGAIQLDGSLDCSNPDLYTVKCNALLGKIDVQQAFYQFENFRQKTLTDQHVRGKVDAQVQFSANLTPSLTIAEHSIVTSADIVVHKGELVGFQPLEKLSSFVKIDELRHVKFETLTNHIIIRDKKVIIPEMEVRSSALDLVISGEHHFNNRIEYHINLLLRDILAHKFKRNNSNRQAEFGDIIQEENKGTRLFILMKGTADNPVITYDAGKVKQKIREDFRKEGQEIRQMLKEDLGLFKKDTTLIREEPLPKKPRENKVKESDGFEFE